MTASGNPRDSACLWRDRRTPPHFSEYRNVANGRERHMPPALPELPPAPSDASARPQATKSSLVEISRRQDCFRRIRPWPMERTSIPGAIEVRSKGGLACPPVHGIFNPWANMIRFTNICGGVQDRRSASAFATSNELSGRCCRTARPGLSGGRTSSSRRRVTCSRSHGGMPAMRPSWSRKRKWCSDGGACPEVGQYRHPIAA